MAKVIGGDKLAAFINKIKSLNGDVKVGYFEGDKYAQRGYEKVDKKTGSKEWKTVGEATPVAYVARIMEYGCTQNITDKQRKFFGAIGYPLSSEKKQLHIPPRPFFVKTFQENHEHYKTMFAEFLIKYDYDIMKSLGAIGNKMKTDIQSAMEKVDSPPKSSLTIEMNGGYRKPLKGSGGRSILKNSINFEVFHK